MNQREKKLLRFFLIVFVIYALPFEVIPFLYKGYDNWQAENELIKTQISGYERLESRQDFWMARHQEMQSEKAGMEKAVFRGATTELVGAHLQGKLKGLADKNGLTIKSIELPDSSEAAGWFMITQSINFSADSRKLLSFLTDVEKSAYHFEVVSLSMRSFGRKLQGNVKITGFGLLSAEVE